MHQLDFNKELFKLLMLFMNTSCDKFEVTVSNSFDSTVVHYTFPVLLVQCNDGVVKKKAKHVAVGFNKIFGQIHICPNILLLLLTY